METGEAIDDAGLDVTVGRPDSALAWLNPTCLVK